MLANDLIYEEKEEEFGENNNEQMTPNQNYVIMPSRNRNMLTSYASRPRITDLVDKENIYTFCDTTEEAPKVPPDIETTSSETTTNHEAPTPPAKRSPPHPLKTNSQFVPLQNGPVKQQEPSAAVAAVTVPNPATVVPVSNPSTSPAGGVPFPSSLFPPCSPKEVCASPGSPKTVSPPTSKSSPSAIKVPATGDVVHSLNYPICSPYPEYPGNYQYNKQFQESGHKNYHEAHYQDHKGYQEGNRSYQESNQKHYPKTNSYQSYQLDKYPKDRSNSKDLSAYDAYKKTTDSYHVGKVSSEGDVNYYTGQNCDPQQPPCKKPAVNNSVYNFKSNELATQNSTVDKTVGNLTNKVPNRTTYYHSIVNKSHSRHKSSRRVLPASAYENAKPAINTYSNVKQEYHNSGKSVQYQQYSDSKKDYYPPVNTSDSKKDYYQSVNASDSKKDYYQTVNSSDSKKDYYQSVNTSNTKKDYYPPVNASDSKRDYYSSANIPETKKDYYPPVSTSDSKKDFYQSDAKKDYYSDGKRDYYQSTYNCHNYRTDAAQGQVNNYHGSYSDSQSPSKTYKSNSELSNSDYRDKHLVNSVSNSKTYSYHHGAKTYSDANPKALVEPQTYGNGSYYQKGHPSYSRSNTSAIGESFKGSNHSGDVTSYTGKHGSYHHQSRSSSHDKNRTFYPTHEGNYKPYQQEPVPKSSENPHGYQSSQVCSDPNVYPAYSNSTSSSVKTKEAISRQSNYIESQKSTSQDSQSSIPIESNQSVPLVSESFNPSIYQTSVETKPPYYPYAEPSSYQQQRTPPAIQAQKPTFETISPPKNTPEPYKYPSANYPQKSCSPVFDNSRNHQENSRNNQDVTKNGQDLGRNTQEASKCQDTSKVSSDIKANQDNSKNTAKTIWSPTSTTTSLAGISSKENANASGRDSSHSNSSISSLSQLSQSLGPSVQTTTAPKEFQREGRSSSNSHSRSSSGNETPVTLPVTTSSPSSSGAYGVSGSLTSLIFSKPSWTSPSAPSVLSSPHLTPPAGRQSSPVPSVLPLAPSLGPFGNQPVMFAPPIPPSGSALASPIAGPSPFGTAESLFAPPPSQELLLRRELDTRFLASQDRSIAVPPPPYLRTEMHQHQHQHTHMHSPFLPPPALAMTQAHLYDKFPKGETTFYGRNALGLPTYPLSPLLAPGSATATPSPFAPPGHVAAFQPKISPFVKTKTLKSGRWCAMHVRISWEIYRHQQKHQAEKTGAGAAVKSMPDVLRQPNLFGSLPRPHELGFSSPLLGAAASIHARSPYDVTPQHPAFLGASPAHLALSPFARPAYPALGVPGNGFGGLSSLGLSGAALLGARDLPPGYLGLPQDPWGRIHRTPPTYPSPTPSWGGLKAEAERDRPKEQEQKDKMMKKEKEGDKSKELNRDIRREQEKQKERDRENRPTHVPTTTPEGARNGDLHPGDRPSRVDWDRRDHRRDNSRSPVRPPAHKSPDDKPKEDKKEPENIRKESPILVVDNVKPPLPPEEYMKYTMGLNPIPPQHHFWNPNLSDRYRALEQMHDREALMQKYASVMPLSYRDMELARHLQSSEAAAREIDRQLQADRDRQVYERSKLQPPPLRTNESPYGLYSPFLNYPPRTKPSSPTGSVSVGNGIPPPLIPCGAQGGSPVIDTTPPSPMHKLPANSESSRDFGKEGRQSESQSR